MGAAPSTNAKKWNQVYISEENGAVVFATNVAGKKVVAKNLNVLGKEYIDTKKAIAQPGSEEGQSQGPPRRTFLQRFGNSRAAASARAREIANSRRALVNRGVHKIQKRAKTFKNRAGVVASSAASAIKRGAIATGSAVKRGAIATGSAVKRGAIATGSAVKRGAIATGSAVKRGAIATGRVAGQAASSAGKTARAFGSATGRVAGQAASSAGKTARAVGSAAGRGLSSAGRGIKSLFTRKSKVAPSPNSSASSTSAASQNNTVANALSPNARQEKFLEEYRDFLYMSLEDKRAYVAAKPTTNYKYNEYLAAINDDEKMKKDNEEHDRKRDAFLKLPRERRIKVEDAYQKGNIKNLTNAALKEFEESKPNTNKTPLLKPQADIDDNPFS